MVPDERGEDSELEPPGAQSLSRISPEPADIRPDHLYSPEVALYIIGDRQFQELVVGIVIASPVEGIPVAARTVGPADDEGGQAAIFEELVGGFLLEH
jgi:hypothetical protein